MNATPKPIDQTPDQHKNPQGEMNTSADEMNQVAISSSDDFDSYHDYPFGTGSLSETARFEPEYFASQLEARGFTLPKWEGIRDLPRKYESMIASILPTTLENMDDLGRTLLRNILARLEGHGRVESTHPNQFEHIWRWLQKSH